MMMHPARSAQRILIVDDDDSIREICSNLLREAGYETAAASSCAAAVAAMESVPPDLVLLDVELPDQDGLSFLTRLAALYPATPVVILTGIGYDESAMQLALQNGARGFVSKNADVENTLAAIRNVLRRSAEP